MLGYMNAGIATSIVFLLSTAACAHRVGTSTRVETASPQVATARSATPIDLTALTANEWQRHLGETVTMHGRFSLYGKIAPYIMVRNEAIYIKPQGSFSWDKSYAQLEGHDVRVTGTLRFIHYDQLPPSQSAEQRAYDHYFFDAETAKVELNR